MKKINAFLLLIVIIFSLAACGANSQESAADNAGTAKNAEIAEGTGAEADLNDTIIAPPGRFCPDYRRNI